MCPLSHIDTPKLSLLFTSRPSAGWAGPLDIILGQSTRLLLEIFEEGACVFIVAAVSEEFVVWMVSMERSG